MAQVGFLVFIGFVIAGLWAAMEIFSYGASNGWPMIGSMALAGPIAGAIVFTGVLVNGAIGKFFGKARTQKGAGDPTNGAAG